MMGGLSASRRVGLAAGAIYAIAWGASALVLARAKPDAGGEAVAVMAIMGIALPALCWLLTLGTRAPETPVARPRWELAAVLLYLVAYGVLFTGYGLNAFHAAVAPGRAQAGLLLGLKLVVHVVLPALLLVALGARVRPLLTARLGSRAFWAPLAVLGAAVLALLSVISPSLGQIAALRLSPVALALAAGGSFIWLALEAGLCEEFLFRAVLQTRLAAVLNSQAAAAFFAALIFAMAHVPGLYMRSGADVAGHSQSLIEVVAYAVATLSPAGLFLGFVWARTRSLLLVVLLHTLVDLLPNIPEFARLWL